MTLEMSNTAVGPREMKDYSPGVIFDRAGKHAALHAHFPAFHGRRARGGALP